MAYDIKNQLTEAMEEFFQRAKLEKGDVVVVGCSASEVGGSAIGTNSSLETAREIFGVIYPMLKDRGLYLAAQCCEHLNRAVIIEKELRDKLGLDRVNVIPQPKAGGSFATTAYKNFENPVAVEKIRADGGIDIGGTLIGMHIKEVCVPVHLKVKNIGRATLLAARTRPKFVGGSRAVYDEKLL